MKKIHLLIILLTALFSCHKTEKMKEKIFPERPYEESQIDNFYWADSGWDYNMIPLIKPYKIIKQQGQQEWLLNSSASKNEISDLAPLESIFITDIYIYGVQGENLNFEETATNSSVYFLINTKEMRIQYFDKESDFKSELKKLNLPEEFLTPDEVYEQYKNDPVLPWFPENIKKQLEEAKAKQRK